MLTGEKLSRRQMIAGGAAAALAAPAAAQIRVINPFNMAPRRFNPLGRQGSVAPLTTADEDPSFFAYSSTLGPSGYTPSKASWNGKTWKADMGSTWNLGMDHSWRVTATADRFELHPTPQDRAVNDSADKRRSELHYKKTELANGMEYWGAYSFIDHSWPDPVGMNLTTGGAHMQMHMPSGNGAAFALRRYRDGTFLVTTNSSAGGNLKQFNAPLSFDAVHDVVYRCICDPAAGELDLWLDGTQVTAFRGLLGIAGATSTAGYYFCRGLYYGGGITCNIVAEFANVVTPQTANLLSRVSSPPPWPAS